MSAATDRAWAAGLFEGEGCFTWQKRSTGRHYPWATLTTTDEDVIRRFAEIMGVGKVTGPMHRANRKPQWKWIAMGHDAMRLIDTRIGEHLGIRRRGRLDELLTFQPERDGPGGAWLRPRSFSPEGRAALQESAKAIIIRTRRAASSARPASPARGSG